MCANYYQKNIEHNMTGGVLCHIMRADVFFSLLFGERAEFFVYLQQKCYCSEKYNELIIEETVETGF